MITLYHIPRSRSVRTLWLLSELQLPFRVVELRLDMAVLRTPEYLAISPAGRVPCIDDDGTIVFESGAITQYLCQRYDPDGLGRTPAHAEWPEWVQWIHFAETMAVHGASLVQQKHFVAPEDRSEVVAGLEQRRLRKTLEVVDRALAGRDYLLASGFSAADISVAYSVFMGNLNCDETGGLDRLGDYYSRIAARPAFIASAAGPGSA